MPLVQNRDIIVLNCPKNWSSWHIQTLQWGLLHNTMTTQCLQGLGIQWWCHHTLLYRTMYNWLEHNIVVAICVFIAIHHSMDTYEDKGKGLAMCQPSNLQCMAPHWTRDALYLSGPVVDSPQEMLMLQSFFFPSTPSMDSHHGWMYSGWG